MSAGPARTLGLVLVDGENEFQRLLGREAETAARAAGFRLRTRVTSSGGNELAGQLDAIGAWIEEPQPPVALLVLAARDRGLARVTRTAARRGIHWIGLNRTEDDLDAVRREFPGVIVATVCPDERETGRLQARLVRRLTHGAGHVLYLTGQSRSLTARDRADGFIEGLADTPHHIVRLEAGWTEEDGEAAAGAWLRLALRARRSLDVVVCQTDALARGALRALRAVRAELQRADLRVPVIGCDGTPGGGQALVAAGELAATVVLPRTAATAIGLLASATGRGTPFPPLTALAGRAWPEALG
jgi:ABC-type sugar transport system substrate-binding protein